jgi:hypothetical protein
MTAPLAQPEELFASAAEAGINAVFAQPFFSLTNLGLRQRGLVHVLRLLAGGFGW